MSITLLIKIDIRNLTLHLILLHSLSDGLKKPFLYRTALLTIYYIAFFTLLGDFIYKQFSILSSGSK